LGGNITTFIQSLQAGELGSFIRFISKFQQ